jgi:hypothetical protein
VPSNGVLAQPGQRAHALEAVHHHEVLGLAAVHHHDRHLLA